MIKWILFLFFCMKLKWDDSEKGKRNIAMKRKEMKKILKCTVMNVN